MSAALRSRIWEYWSCSPARLQGCHAHTVSIAPPPSDIYPFSRADSPTRTRGANGSPGSGWSVGCGTVPRPGSPAPSPGTGSRAGARAALHRRAARSGRGRVRATCSSRAPWRRGRTSAADRLGRRSPGMPRQLGSTRGSESPRVDEGDWGGWCCSGSLTRSRQSRPPRSAGTTCGPAQTSAPRPAAAPVYPAAPSGDVAPGPPRCRSCC